MIQDIGITIITHGKFMNDIEEKLLDNFVKAAKLQQFALNNGGWGHAGWCNYPRLEGNGKGKCNCGVSDLQSALKQYEDYKNKL